MRKNKFVIIVVGKRILTKGGVWRVRGFINSSLGNRIRYKNVNEKIIIILKVIFLFLNFNFEDRLKMESKFIIYV